MKIILDEEQIEQKETTSQGTWNSAAGCCKRAAEDTLGIVTRNKKYTDQKLEMLSEKSQKIGKDIESCQNQDTRKKKREERKEVKKETKTRIKEIKENELNIL